MILEVGESHITLPFKSDIWLLLSSSLLLSLWILFRCCVRHK